MRFGILATPARGQADAGLGAWLLFVLVNSLLFTAVVESAPTSGARSKRDAGSELVNKLKAGFEAAIPITPPGGTDLLDSLITALGPSEYTTTANSKDPLLRTTNQVLVKTNFLYGPSVGGGPAYPTGLLGLAKVVYDVVQIQLDLLPELVLAGTDAVSAALGVGKYNGLQTMADYVKLYDGEWKGSLPNGPDPGVLTNYEDDLFFSMQRLSASPYQVRRLSPSDSLSFTISDADATQIAGQTLKQLLAEGRLFYADYRDQAKLAPADRYAAAVDAYFYIDSKSGDFLPLAIRTNVGSNLVYTKLDSPGDWLLAKMMYNVNDFWFAQWNHLAATHQVLQIVWAAGIRALSQEHPVFQIMNRLTYQAYSIQILAKGVLFLPGGAVDSVFPYTGQSAQDYTTSRYNGPTGRFQANYFRTELASRGLTPGSAPTGPDLKSFPFADDASAIFDATRAFMAAFVKSYYPSDAAVAADAEIQAWAKEANGAAKVADFPSSITSTSTLTDILTHIAHLGSTAHHTVNTNELLQISSALPFNPPALYKPIPSTKSNATNPADWLPKLDKVLEQFSVGALFARPLLAGSANRSIVHMFDDEAMLSRMNAGTRAANAAFVSAMRSFSAEVSGRGFGADGLCQGMPFVWKALDPSVAPFSTAT